MPSDRYTLGVRRSLPNAADVVARLDEATRRVQENGRLEAVLSEYV